MSISIPIPIGEILDKLALLEIKENNLKNESKKENCMKERTLILSIVKNKIDEYSFWYKVLKEIHVEIWKLQENNSTESPQNLITLNEMKYRLKQIVNTYSKCEFQEEKEYKPKNILFTQPVSFETIFKYRHILYYLALLFDNIYLIANGFQISEMFLPSIHLLNLNDYKNDISNLVKGTETSFQWFFCEYPLNEALIDPMGMSKTILQSLTPKSALVVNHLGLGDIINFSGAVHYLSENYDDVYIVTYKSNFISTKTLYSTNHKIKILDVPKEEVMWNLQKRDWSIFFKPIIPYFSREFRTGIYLDITKSCANFPDCFYEDIQIPLSVRKSHFRIPYTKESQELYSLLEGKTYIFTQQKCSELTLNLVTWDKYKTLTIDPNINVYNKDDEFYMVAEKVRNKPFFHYTDIIKNAQEIYVINSAFAMYAYHIHPLRANVRKMFEREKGDEVINYFYE